MESRYSCGSTFFVLFSFAIQPTDYKLDYSGSSCSSMGIRDEEITQSDLLILKKERERERGRGIERKREWMVSISWDARLVGEELHNDGPRIFAKGRTRVLARVSLFDEEKETRERGGEREREKVLMSIWALLELESTATPTTLNYLYQTRIFMITHLYLIFSILFLCCAFLFFLFFLFNPQRRALW